MSPSSEAKPQAPRLPRKEWVKEFKSGKDKTRNRHFVRLAHALQ